MKKKVDEPEDEFTISDAVTAKKYAVTSYLKLLTARVLRLEQEMARHKKVSVIMVGKNGEETEEEDEEKVPDSAEKGDKEDGKEGSPKKTPKKDDKPTKF